MPPPDEEEPDVLLLSRDSVLLRFELQIQEPLRLENEKLRRLHRSNNRVPFWANLEYQVQPARVGEPRRGVLAGSSGQKRHRGVPIGQQRGFLIQAVSWLGPHN